MTRNLVRFLVTSLFLLLPLCLADLADQTCSADDESCQSQVNDSDEVNKHENCNFWASKGECKNNPDYMLINCARSCKKYVDNIEEYKLQYLLNEEPPKSDDPESIGVKQVLTGSMYQADPKAFSELIVSSHEYVKNLDMKKDLKDLCKNKHKHCTAWAVAGECEKNPGYMKLNCAPACLSCDYLSVEGRCPMDPNAPEAWDSGDLNKMFEKLSSEPYLTKYSVETLSSPATGGPWVITMDDVVSEEEAARLIELGAIEGYERSTDVGKMKADGTTEKKVSTGRTSTNAWCLKECYKDPSALAVINRLSNLTGIDEINSEYLQLLKYEPGQFYNVHHDYIAHHTERQQGVRILTVYLYLNDVEAGGGTNFDRLDITVMPKRGRALLWPSVLNESPHKKDGRTTHQALPVEKGTKYGANAWFHMRDFKTPHESGCQ